MNKSAESQEQSDAPAAKRSRISILRGLSALAVVLLVIVGLIFSSGTGTLSSFGIDFISTICPLGALESMLGSWSFIPRALIALLVVLLIVAITGKAFCSWLCPMPHLRSLFKSKKRKNLEQSESAKNAQHVLAEHNERPANRCKKAHVDSRHAVLGGALLSTAIFGFPVFCLVCPIGLSFGTIVLVWRLFQFNEPTWGLLIFPLIIIVEVVFLRKWCEKICPLGALLSLVSHVNKTWRPTVDSEKCIRQEKNGTCVACATACPEHIDPCENIGERDMTECVKCHACAETCPTKAITFPFVRKKARSGVASDTKGSHKAQEA